MATRRTNVGLLVAPWLFTIGFFLLWEVGCRAFKVSTFVLPPPSLIFAAMGQFAGPLTYHSLHTLWMTLAGFGLAILFGLLLGIALGASRLIQVGTYPLLVGFNAVPKVAVVPILVIWFGVGAVPAIITAFVISFFPIVVNVATGLATIEPELEDVLRSLGASKLDILLKVGIPRSLPYLFASLKVAITLAFVGSVISETVAGSSGIGHVMLVASSSFDVPLVFAGLLVIAAMGIGMYAIFAAIEHRFTGWATRGAAYATGG
jgi:NitT/TauT family transport system permease protein